MTVETLCRSLHQLEERGVIRLLAPDLVEVRDRPRLRLPGCGQEDDRLQLTLLQDGWEWGARSLGSKVAARVPMLRPVAVGR